MNTQLISLGLAIFSMLFGAGNLMYPLQVGMVSGDKTWIGIIGFLITAVCLPIAGFIGMILFNGDYQAFFNRLGKPIGSSMIFICMMIIGPAIALPRITTLSHTMIAPFLPWSLLNHTTLLSSLIFSLCFLSITFVLTYKESRIMQLLGYIISPSLLAALLIIITKGLLFPDDLLHQAASSCFIFTSNLTRGYETLDLLGALFFSSIIITLLKNTLGSSYEQKKAVTMALQASIIGVSLLGCIYVGMSLLGAYHGQAFHDGNAGELFRAISFKVLGAHGAFIIATAVLMACLSTAIALAAVVAEYLHGEIFHKRISYVPSLIIVLASCLPLSIAGLSQVLALTGGIITYVGYPVLIALTFCNIAYKTCGFTPVKLPVALTFIGALTSYLMA
ncbi:MAG: branched-chain amino acid transport system II carrier protein [Candidatus Babeliales bacterium]